MIDCHIILRVVRMGNLICRGREGERLWFGIGYFSLHLYDTLDIFKHAWLNQSCQVLHSKARLGSQFGLTQVGKEKVVTTLQNLSSTPNSVTFVSKSGLVKNF